MRITALSLKNFRNYEQLDLEFPTGRTLLIGENGSGKSTIIDAIAWVLLGRCRGVNAKGEGQKDLIRHGAQDCHVAMDFDDGTTVWRSIGRDGSVSSSHRTPQILGELGVSEGMLQAVLYSQAFFDLHHAEAKALLMDALNVTIPKTDLPGVDLPAEVDAVDLAHLDELYDAAYQARTLVKRDLTQLRVPERPKVIDIKLQGQTVDDLQKKHAEHQRRMEGLVRTQATADQAVAARNGAIAAAEGLAGQIDHTAGVLKAQEDMLATVRARLSEAEQRRSDAQAQPAEPVDTLLATVREHELLIEKLGRHDPDRGCVLSPGIPCLTQAERFTGYVGQMRDTVSMLGDRIKAGQERAAALSAIGQTIRDAERDIAYHTTQIAQAGEKLAAAKDSKAALKTLKAGLPDLKKAARDAAAEVVAARTDGEHQFSQLRILADYLTAQAAHQKGVTARQELEAKVDQAEALVKLLGPTGVRVRALDAALSAFVTAMNAALTRFGFDVNFSVDPWLVAVRIVGGDMPVRFEMLSKGQKLWVGLAFQLALADVSGLDFCVIDDLEAVVGQNRAEVTATVMTSHLGQILVSMAKADNEPGPAFPGLQVVRLREGQPVAATA